MLGLFGSFAFSDLTSTTGRITFRFFGSTFSAPGSFAIDLGSFATTDGDKITNIVYDSGNLATGSFSAVSFNGANAVFTGSTASSYNAIGGRSVLFDVTMAAVPEPATCLAVAFAGLAVTGYVRRRRAQPPATA